jgi:TP901 family phage tail tape measure protein
MANKIEYIFSLRDQISAKLAGITATSEKARSALSGVQEKVRSAEDVFQETGKTIGSLKARIDALQAEKEWIPADNLPAIKEYNREIARLTGELNQLETAAGGGKFRKWASEAFDAIPGASLLKNPLVTGMTAATLAGSAGMTFDENMAKVNITAQLDETGLEDLKKRLKQIAADNKTDVQVVPVGFEAINSQVNDVELSLSILDAALKGSKAGFTDLDTVSAALAQTLSIVGKENTTAQEVLDTFFAAKRVGAGEFADFARYMPNLIAGADNLGIAYKEVAGTFAYMTGKGQSAERAATLMENAFSVLGRVDVRKKMEAAGVDVFDDTGKIRSIVDIFTDLQNVLGGLNDEQKSSLLEQFGLVDKEAKSAFSVLMSDTEKLRESMYDVANSTGETTAALGYSRNAMQQATEVWNQFKNIGLQVGEIMLPVISAGLTVAGGVLDGVSVVMDAVIGFFSGWYTLIQEGNPVVIGLTTTLGILTAAMAVNYAWTQRAILIGGLKKAMDIAQTVATGGLTAAQWALNAAFYASPLGIIAAGIGVVVGIVTLCWQKFEGFRMVVLGVWEVIKEFGRTLFDSIVTPFQKILSGIGSVGTAIVQLVKGNFSEAADAAKQGFKEIGEGVLEANPVSVAYNTFRNGNYSAAWEKGKQAGRDSWAASQAEKTTPAAEQPAVTNPLQPTSTPMASLNFDKLLASLETGKKTGVSRSGKSKVLDLNDTPGNLSESSAYSAITRKMKPREVSLLPESMRKVAATVAVPLAMAASPATAGEIPVPNISDAYNVENIRETNNTFTADNSRTYNNSGRTYQIGKVCDEVVIHVANTDQKGSETIRREIMNILEELGEG